ncbi:ATP-binding protein [Desulfobacterales bacterium HSG17]|nr:ATP-binding protein [Desulfobacterales bacterium HSG17]
MSKIQDKSMLSEKKMQRHSDNLKAIFNSIPSVLMLLNEDLRVEIVNHSGVTLAGKKEEELIGFLGGQVLNCLHSFEGKGCGCNPDCSTCPVRTRVTSTFQTGKSHNEEEGQMTFLVNDHEISRDLLITTTLLKLDGASKILLSLTDITQRKRAEQEKKRLEAQLHQSQKMESIGTLAGGIAHDFNNILFPVMGYTEMLLEDTSEDDPIMDSLEQIYNGTLRAKELVQQILTFARQKDGELKLMQMQPMVKEAIKLLRSTIPTTIEIKQNIQTDCKPIKADPTQIHQIVMNLATNAYHAMEEKGGKLTIILKEIEFTEDDPIIPDITSGVYACLTIQDTGRGMNKALTQKIFEPFFTTKRQGKGTGMGLSVVHGIVKNMSGAIQVYSEPGKGTQFNIYLPVVQTRSEQLTDIPETIQTGSEHILLVDDEVTIIEMEQAMLERLGYGVTTRSSSIDALEAFRSNPDKFDLIITDMAMPNMAGDKLSVEINQIRPDIPILLCTGFSEIMSEEKAKSLGISGFLLKPIIAKALSKKIREVLD